MPNAARKTVLRVHRFGRQESIRYIDIFGGLKRELV